MEKNWGDKVSDHFVDFSLKGLDLSKAEKRTVSTVGWYFLHALYTESQRREKAEAEVKVLKDQLAVASECVCSTASWADDLQERCAALMTKSINALRKRKGRKPVSKARVRAIVTSQNWDCEDVSSNEDEEIEFDVSDNDYVSYSDDSDDLNEFHASPIMPNSACDELNEVEKGL